MPTLKTYRRDAARALSLLDVVTTTAEASGADAEVSVVVASFAGAIGQTTYENSYVLPTTGAQAGQQRITRTNGLSPTSATLKVTWGWPAPLETGTEVELLRLIPATTDLGRSGWNEIINDVLRDIPTYRRHPVEATEGTTRYAVPFYLAAEDQAIGVFDPSRGGPELLSQNLKSIRWDAETVEIELWHGYPAGAVFHLAVYQPAGHRVLPAGGTVWGDDADGLADDADETVADRRLVRAMAIVRAAELELRRPDPRSRPMWTAALAEFTPVAASLKRRIVPARPRHMTVGAPAVSGWPKQLF